MKELGKELGGSSGLEHTSLWNDLKRPKGVFKNNIKHGFWNAVRLELTILHGIRSKKH